MAATYLCDGGCGTQADDLAAFTESGYVIKRWYCPDCASVVREHQVEIDKAHEAAAAAFKRDVAKAREKMHKRKMRLPDVPD